MINAEKPVIGVTGPSRGGFAAWVFTKLSLWLAGGKAVRITSLKKVDFSRLHGLVLGGGADVEPERYGEILEEEDIMDEEIKGEKSLKRIVDFIISLLFFPFMLIFRKIYSTKDSPVDPERDDLEFSVLANADERSIPVLGICRGMQLINVYFKGDLYQDIGEFYVEKPQVTTLLPKKKVIIESDTCLAKILGDLECKVNALHKQAIRNLGTDCRVSAMEENGVIQAIEHTKKPFLLGVQWHPEYLVQIREQRRLFKALVNEAKKNFN